MRTRSASSESFFERRTTIPKIVNARKANNIPGPKLKASAPNRPQRIMPVPSVTRSANTVGAVRATGVPATCRTKTLFNTSPSLPGEMVMERPAAKMATFSFKGTETFRTRR